MEGILEESDTEEPRRVIDRKLERSFVSMSKVGFRNLFE